MDELNEQFCLRSRNHFGAVIECAPERCLYCIYKYEEWRIKFILSVNSREKDSRKNSVYHRKKFKSFQLNWIFSYRCSKARLFMIKFSLDWNGVKGKSTWCVHLVMTIYQQIIGLCPIHIGYCLAHRCECVWHTRHASSDSCSGSIKNFRYVKGKCKKKVNRNG